MRPGAVGPHSVVEGTWAPVMGVAGARLNRPTSFGEQEDSEAIATWQPPARHRRASVSGEESAAHTRSAEPPGASTWVGRGGRGLNQGRASTPHARHAEGDLHEPLGKRRASGDERLAGAAHETVQGTRLNQGRCLNPRARQAGSGAVLSPIDSLVDRSVDEHPPGGAFRCRRTRWRSASVVLSGSISGTPRLA